MNIRYSFQSIDEEDIAAVVEVLRSPNLTQGPKIAAFEEAIAAYCGVEEGVACANGSAALHLACMAAEVGPGDEVITSPNTFTASATCALYCGGKPVFADIDRRFYNLSPAELEKRISKKTKAVIPVHFAGQSCDMQAIQKIVRDAEKKYGRKIFIIEDAAHALGSKYKGREVGSCVYSDMTIFSFHPVKHITTGEGGMVVTREKRLADAMKRLRSHGITSAAGEFLCPDDAYEPLKKGSGKILKSWYYEQIFLGYHYRTTDIQCALGISQLKKLPRFMKRRREIARFYDESFEGIDKIQKPYLDPDGDTNLHLYVLLLDFERMALSRAQLMSALKEKGIQTQVHYIPVYIHPLFRQKCKTDWGECPNTEWYYQRCLSIPLHPSMTDEETRFVSDQIRGLCGIL